MERTIINTNIRLNLNRPADRQAWEYLQNLDRKRFKSYSSAVVTAINDYYSRQERLGEDSYLETREKEDAFLEKVLETIREGLRSSDTGLAGLAALFQNIQPTRPVTTPEEDTMSEEDYAIAMDFINSL